MMRHSTVASSLSLEEQMRHIEIFPDGMIKYVTNMELTVLILISSMVHIVLFTLGHRRKYICNIWIRFTVWSAYLLADWVAFIALGSISTNTLDERQKGRNSEDPHNELTWLWAQFFLLHSGGPDTITSYSFEDNELWLRHLMGFLIQTALAFYILLFSWSGSSWLPLLNVLIFIAGLIKYGERVVALRAANSENFRGSMLKEPDPGPNYRKFMEKFTLKKAEGFCIEVDEIVEISVPFTQFFPDDCGKLIPEAYDLFLTFKPLFADLIISSQDRDSSQSYFHNLLPKQAFDVVEVELGFLFDELYTKTSQVFKVGGFVRQMITFSLTVSAFMAFLFVFEKSKYGNFDLAITYLLLVVTIYLQLYAMSVSINSDWTDNWLSRHERSRLFPIIQWFPRPANKRRWSEKMTQHNLLDLCVRDNPAVCLRIQKFLIKLFKIDNYLEEHGNNTTVNVCFNLKCLIFNEVKEFTREDFISQEGEFDRKVVLWHMTTDICYSLEWGDNQENVNSNRMERKQMSDHSKHLSDYMMYLLVECSFMLPEGIGTIRFCDTCAEAKRFFEEKKLKSGKASACKSLLQVNTDVPPAKVKGDRSKSLLFEACILAKSLQAKEEKWEIISKEWVKMLAYAAFQSRGNHHIRQLRKGGELLTIVWLLMAHLGITKLFQISQGHARPKLRVT